MFDLRRYVSDAPDERHVAPPRPGPAQAVRLVYQGHTKWFSCCASACRWANRRALVGAKVYGLECGKLLAEIERYDPDYVFELDRTMPIGNPVCPYVAGSSLGVGASIPCEDGNGNARNLSGKVLAGPGSRHAA